MFLTFNISTKYVFWNFSRKIIIILKIFLIFKNWIFSYIWILYNLKVPVLTFQMITQNENIGNFFTILPRMRRILSHRQGICSNFLKLLSCQMIAKIANVSYYTTGPFKQLLFSSFIWNSSTILHKNQRHQIIIKMASLAISYILFILWMKIFIWPAILPYKWNIIWHLDFVSFLCSIHYIINYNISTKYVFWNCCFYTSLLISKMNITKSYIWMLYFKMIAYRIYSFGPRNWLLL